MDDRLVSLHGKVCIEWQTVVGFLFLLKLIEVGSLQKMFLVCRDYTNVTLPSEHTRASNPGNNNIVVSLTSSY
jgi:hypothetical protein